MAHRGVSRKMHVVHWEKICKPKSNGGLAIQSLRRRDIALIS